MPIYEFECHKCKKIFEYFCKDYSTTIVTCPFCNSDGHKIISLSKFSLHGGGWEKDGYCKSK